MMRKFLLFALVFALINVEPLKVQDSETKFFEKFVAELRQENLQDMPFGELVCHIGKKFLGFPYLAGSLEKGKDEQCVVTFAGFDCVTFFEITLALARITITGRTEFAVLLREVQRSRYRGGKVIDYASRLHYSADWIWDNIAKGIVRDRTKELGGVPIRFNVNYMSANPDLYSGLKNQPEQIEKIKQVEQEISERTYYYIPTANVSKIESKLKSGDIIFFVLDSGGLDYSHVGICCVEGAETRLLHSSSKADKVVLDKKISEYCKAHKKIKGITVLEPLMGGR